jgi:ketosteroid isomerase-like protein
MKRSVAVFLVFVPMLLASDPADGVRAAAAAWRKAIVAKDEAALQRLCADDLTYTHASGTTQDKATYIAAVLKTGRYESFAESDTKIRVYGKTAILTGFVDVKMIDAEPYRVRTIEVYVEHNGQWQLTAKQAARIRR